MNATDAARDTKNSEVSTDPITVCGAVLPALNRAVVEIGPHPPPPVASMNPPTSPSGIKKRLPCGDVSWPGRSAAA